MFSQTYLYLNKYNTPKIFIQVQDVGIMIYRNKKARIVNHLHIRAFIYCLYF